MNLEQLSDDELLTLYDETDAEVRAHCWDHFTAYNVIDVDLVRCLDGKMKLTELALTISYDSKIVPDEVFSQMAVWDSLIYNELKARHIVIPNKKNNKREMLEGAYVKEPLIGKHKWVVSFDLQSLYPHLIMWANISPETMVATYRKNVTVDALLARKVDNEDLKEHNYAMTANGVCYDRSARGFLADIVSRIYNDRSKYKKQMLALEQEYATTKNEELVGEISRLNALQMARKIQINSVYGACGSPFFRYYDLRIAEGITTSGQLAIRWVGDAINTYLNKACKTEGVDYIIYSDTDSVYVTLETLVEKHLQGTTEELVRKIDVFCAEVLQRVINKAYDDLADYMNAYDQKLIMKREVIADCGVFVKKKRYALNVHNSEGVQYKEPKLKVTGLDLVRSSTPPLARRVLKEGVSTVLFGEQKDVQRYIAEHREAYLAASLNEIAFPRGVNGLKTYTGSPIYKSGCPIHVRAALLYNHYLKAKGVSDKYEEIKEGTKMRFVYLNPRNPTRENVIGYLDKLPPEFGLDQYIDHATMYEKSVVEAMKTLVEPLGWDTEERASLESLFE